MDLFRPDIAAVIEIKPANDQAGARDKAERAVAEYDPSVSRLCRVVYCDDFAHLYPTESDGKPSEDAWMMEGEFDTGFGARLIWGMPEAGVITYEWVPGEPGLVPIPDSKLKRLKDLSREIFDKATSDAATSGNLGIPKEVENISAFAHDWGLSQAEIQGVLEELAPFGLAAGGAAAALALQRGVAPR